MKYEKQWPNLYISWHLNWHNKPLISWMYFHISLTGGPSYSMMMIGAESGLVLLAWQLSWQH